MSYLTEVLKQRSDGKENLGVKTCHLCGKNGEGLAVVAEHVGGLVIRPSFNHRCTYIQSLTSHLTQIMTLFHSLKSIYHIVAI